MATPPRPPRDPRLEPYLQNRATWDILLTLAGRPYAGDHPDPRPVPRTTLHDFKQRAAAVAPPGSSAVPDALYWAFYADRYSVAREEAITVPSEHLWWLATAQDDVLLSDRVTHHYTTIAAVDREGERVSFHDAWPESFFLLPGRNTLGIAARLDPGLSVSKPDFLRAAVGLVTWDTTRLVPHYFAAFPEQRENADVLLRFGLAVLDAEADHLTALAAPLCVEAARVAADPALRELAARQAFIAATCGAYYAAPRRDQRMLDAMQAVLRIVVPAHGRETLESGASAAELTRLGNAAGHAGDLAVARKFCDRAIATESFEDAYSLRAGFRLRGGDAQGAAADAARAIELNDERLARFQAERAALDPRSTWEIEWKDRLIGGHRGRRQSELATLREAIAGIGDRAQRARYESVLAQAERGAG